MKSNSQFSILNSQFASAFTLIEMLVTIAIIAIVSGVIIVGISPKKRIEDAQDSRAKQDVRQVATAVEACLSYANPNPAAGASATNAATDCDTPAELISKTGTPMGGPFARSVPGVTFLTTSGSTICFYELGSPSNYWYYTTDIGQVKNQATVPTCP